MKKILASLFMLITTLAISEENKVSSEGIIPSEDQTTMTTYEERKEKRKRMFPLFSEQAEARGINLPLPFGVSMFGNVTNVTSTGDGIDIDTDDGFSGSADLKLKGDITAQITGVMLDFYPLPMLNVFGYGAYIRTSGDLDIGFGNSPMKRVDFGDEGKAFGTGFNLAGGFGHFFGAVNASYSFTKMDGTGAIKETMIITPRLGLKNQANTFQVWAGLMFMNKDNELEGQMPADAIGGLPGFNYTVHLKAPEHSPTIGFRYVPVDHFEVVCEAFLASEFNGVNLRLAYRF
jgi:hypothetical protein